MLPSVLCVVCVVNRLGLMWPPSPSAPALLDALVCVLFSFLITIPDPAARVNLVVFLCRYLVDYGQRFS